MNSSILLLHATLITPLQVMQDGAVFLQEGKIAAVGSSSDLEYLRDKVGRVIDCTGKTVAPGFIDIHVHGAGGQDAMAGTVEAVLKMAAQHAQGGTTAMAPATICAPEADILKAVQAVGEASRSKNPKGASILGAHVEGPFFAQSRRGAQNPEYVINPTGPEVDHLLELAADIRVMSAAPELPGGIDLGRKLLAKGIVPSMGHSDANYFDIIKAVEAGYRSVTHLYCAMSQWVNNRGEKVMGLSETALVTDELFVELIADGNHVSPHFMQWTYKAKGADKVCLITDAISFAGMPPGEYKLGGVDIVVSPTSARLSDGSANAGSVATMGLCVRNVVKAGVPLADALRSATLTPARLVGVDHAKGTLTPGKDADVVVLSSDLEVEKTIVGGNVVFESVD